MREYMGLYRGKRLDNGEGVEGWYCKAAFVRWPLRDAIIPKEKAEEGHYQPYEVDPDTVGECTGIPDKNGKLIFEGDLFRFDDDCVGVVIFKDGCFRMQVHGMCGTYTESGYSEDGGGWGIVECEPIDWYYFRDLEIIGNIHDNPDLLEGARENDR